MTREQTFPKPVKLFIGMLSHDVTLIDEIKVKLEEIFGPSDMQSPVWDWGFSDYYLKEMGAGLKKQFIFFKKHIDPGMISGIKLKTVALEKDYLNDSRGRRINIDPGYLDSAKVVLVSTKDYSHRLYLGNNIYGEVTLAYSGNSYQIFPFTYPDFRTADYIDIFEKARGRYKADIKTLNL